ncbi:transmembrane protein, putative [Bodo saltans]|uniref:Transmembrane protein, putative n=1 Tax=Bodo saltans TaxID=75058 RepID=A0A0S4JGL4_BODSA|nr:transmembrane protein, putative [Bodo saltans]|eukprot:CUG90684.1 transmembrane protein, putative [Bodo saltans]
MITFPEPLTTAATPHPHSDDALTTTEDAARHVVVNVQRLQPQDVFTDDDDVSSTQQPPAVNGQQHSERSGDDARSDRTGSSTAGGSSHRHLRGSQHHNTHHLHHHQNNSTRRRRREQEEMVESLRGDSFLRTNIGPMFGPLHQGSVAAVLRRPSHHHDDNTVVFRNGKLNVMRSRWILCYAHATIEDEFYVFSQSHRGGAIATCFVAAALILLGNVVYAITTELTSLAYGLYATSIVGFLAAGLGMRWLDVALKALRVEYGLGDPLDTAEGYCQSCTSTNKNEVTGTSSRTMDPRQPHVQQQQQHVRPPPVSSDLGNHVGGGLRGFQNFLPLLVRDDVPPQGITAAATTPAAAATGLLSHQHVTTEGNNNIDVTNGKKKQSTSLHCWRHAFRINAAAHEIFAMVGIISCFVYS